LREIGKFGWDAMREYDHTLQIGERL